MATVLKSEFYDELAAQVEGDTEWLWRGYLAAGNVTLLTSQWKTGKTTLLSVLLARLHDGRELGGQTIRPSRAAVISEESRPHWRMRGKRLDFGPAARFFCRPFSGKPTHDEWLGLIQHLVELRASAGLDLVVIDTLSTFFPPGVENNSDALQGALRPLDQLTAAGLAVLLMHHPRKGTLLPGQAARGSGALTSYADILLEMTFYKRGKRADRRRRISSWSRHSETPEEMILKLNDDGNDYENCLDVNERSLRVVNLVKEMLTANRRQMTRIVIRDQWPRDDRPSPARLRVHLERGVALGELVREGSGLSRDPFRYSLPGVELPWEMELADRLATLP